MAAPRSGAVDVDDTGCREETSCASESIATRKRLDGVIVETRDRLRISA